VDYRLAPEFKYPTQLDELSTGSRAKVDVLEAFIRILSAVEETPPEEI